MRPQPPDYPGEMTMNPSPYLTQESRLDARRQSYRDSKRRKAHGRKAANSALEEYVLLLCSSGNGPAWRKELMIDILAKGKG